MSEFKYGDLVKVTHGFFEGLEGRLVDMKNSTLPFYTVQLSVTSKNNIISSREVEIALGFLKKVEEKI